MNGLPNEIQTHILYFLPPTDVLRFQQLNNHTRNLTRKHFHQMQKLVNLFVVDRPSCRENLAFFNFSFKLITEYGEFEAIADYPQGSTKRPQIKVCDDNARSRSFFSAWKALHDSQQDLRVLFDFLLSKGDVSLDMRKSDILYLPSANNDLIHALKESKNMYREITLDETMSAVLERAERSADFYCSLLKNSKQSMAVVHSKILSKSVQFQFGMVRLTSRIHKTLSDDGFRPFCIVFHEKQVCEIIYSVVQHWRMHSQEFSGFSIKFIECHRECDLVIRLYCNFTKISEDMVMSVPDDFLRTHSFENLPMEMEFGLPDLSRYLKISFSLEESSAIRVNVHPFCK